MRTTLTVNTAHCRDSKDTASVRLRHRAQRTTSTIVELRLAGYSLRPQRMEIYSKTPSPTSRPCPLNLAHSIISR
ncbi:hypothetical protein J6590_054365 [Homalodisca vitripennis]|nr:hypothetical protein J6590_054365 [Homalodisca vitripennis]